MDKEITLVEALCGTEFDVALVGGEVMTISTFNEIINPEEKRTIKGKGMPFFKDPLKLGNLYIHFKVKFPKNNELSKEQLFGLAKVFAILLL